MKKSNSQTNEQNKLKGQAQSLIEWWNDKAAMKSNDSMAVKAKKVIIRIVGVVFIIALSPVLLMGFLVAFIVML